MLQLPTDVYELGALLSRRLDGQTAQLGMLDAYYEGRQPASFLSPESREALGGRLPQLSINVCRLAVSSLTERLRLQGFRTPGTNDVDAGLTESMRRNGFDLMADTVHTNTLTHGRAAVIVWADEYGDPLITAESAAQTTVISDPATRRPLVAFKRWHDTSDVDSGTGYQNGVIYGPQRIVTLRTRTGQPFGSWAAFGGAWEIVESLPNPTGVVPVVAFRNSYGRSILGAVEGTSELDDLLGLNDALIKLAADMMVGSEVAARPRRWATGMELVPKTDATGQPMRDEDGEEVFLNPFSSNATRVWMTEGVETKFGQFPAADLSPYTDAMASILEKISAVSALPGHMLGITSSQPPSADGIRAAETSLTSRAHGKIRQFSPAWARVAQLETAIRTGQSPDTVRVEPIWESPETRTPTQDADTFSKVVAAGVPLDVALTEILGWDAEQVEAVRRSEQTAATTTAVASLFTTLPAAPAPTQAAA